MSLFLVDRTVTIITVLRDTRSQLAAVETNLSNTEEARKAIEAKVCRILCNYFPSLLMNNSFVPQRLALAKEVETLHRDLNVFTSQSSAMQAQIKRLNSQLQSKRMVGLLRLELVVFQYVTESSRNRNDCSNLRNPFCTSLPCLFLSSSWQVGDFVAVAINLGSDSEVEGTKGSIKVVPLYK